ncbi:uncharacterized protein ALTATR162_LOCUS556 [Alternaria atra]|jgi:hypothetical protein|uniref:Uncharacterized protein n=1 Tax=Alternaria atra TaxID=119953 RepID=A0A8J2HVE0_9PLEO|nr:uncharacterized protein ALTATR162_LOCUS556 [Alternaria atra]CAG5139739.1 unnamed protein product [Alternaria atra]
MSERAEQLTKKLRKEFGDVPPWKTASTQTRLDEGDSEWSITRRYYERAHDYDKFLPLARMLHRKLKKEIGQCPAITEYKIREWLALEYWTDTQVKIEYRLEFDKARPEVRRAKKLLVEMRRDLGDCHMVGDLKILGWIEYGLTDKHIKDKYQGFIVRANLVSRAEALQYRLGDEVSRRLNVSVPELLKHFDDNLDEDQIVEDYRKRTSKP